MLYILSRKALLGSCSRASLEVGVLSVLLNARFVITIGCLMYVEWWNWSVPHQIVLPSLGTLLICDQQVIVIL